MCDGDVRIETRATTVLRCVVSSTHKQTGQLTRDVVSGLFRKCLNWILPPTKTCPTKLVFNEPVKTYQENCYSYTEIRPVRQPYSTYKSLQSINHFITHFSSFSNLLCCSALARAMAPVSVRPLSLRLQWVIIRYEHTWARST